MVSRNDVLTPRRLLAVATGIAAVATTGSLYFSLGLGLIPCELCWYQRIAMYPLVVILGVATLENRPNVVWTAAPLAVIGGSISLYHSYIQVAGDMTCSVHGSCTAILLQVFGIFSIPNLALIAFSLILGALAGLVYITPTIDTPW